MHVLLVAAPLLAEAGPADALITSGFASVTTTILVVLGAAFTLVGLITAAAAGIKWIKKIGKSS